MTNETILDSTRHAVARLVARYFLRHLLVEVTKPDEVLCDDYPGRPIREYYFEMIDQVRQEFDITPDEELPTENIFDTWCELNGKFHYFDSGIYGYSRMFHPRLLDLRDGTSESRRSYYNIMRESFAGFDYERQGFTVAFFLDSATNMRDLLRRVVREQLPEMAVVGDQIIVEQSRALQSAMYEYFEGILKNTLAENVRLLHGILPDTIASELKQNGHVEPVHFPDAGVIFTDFEKFSQSAAHLTPREVIHRLDMYFSEFDQIIETFGLEKIKTIGDSYMAVAGVPEPLVDPVRAVCDAALEIRQASERISQKIGAEGWNIRIGVHVGPLMAGVIGRHKFSYDVWGATVNFASRMESSGEPGRINTSADIYARVTSDYRWEPRGQQPIKQLGLAEMFFLEGKS